MDLRLGFRLTESHLYPNNFEKMKVNKTAQLLSRKAAIALKIYLEHKKTADKFKGNILFNDSQYPFYNSVISVKVVKRRREWQN